MSALTIRLPNSVHDKIRELAQRDQISVNQFIASAAAEKTADLYKQQFREGRRSVFDLLDSQQILFDARARQLSNTTDKTLAEFRVLQQLGGLFDLVSEGQPLPKIAAPAPGARQD